MNQNRRLQVLEAISEGTIPNSSPLDEEEEGVCYNVSKSTIKADSNKRSSKKKLSQTSKCSKFEIFETKLLYVKNQSEDSSKHSSVSTCPKGSSSDQIEKYKNKISFLKNIAKQLEEENLILSRNVAQCDKLENFKFGKKRVEDNMDNLADELASLRNQLQEFGSNKSTLENSGKNLKLTASKLKTLKGSISQSSKVQSISFSQEVVELHKRLEKELNSFKDQVLEIHSKEVETLNTEHRGRLKNIEGRFDELLTKQEDDFSEQISQLGWMHEKKLLEFRDEFQLAVLSKNREIERLQCFLTKNPGASLVSTKLNLYNGDGCKEDHQERKLNSSPNQKFSIVPKEKGETVSLSGDQTKQIKFLESCVSNLEELFQKSEKIYGKQIDKLKKEIGTRDKSLKLHMIAQKAEMVTSSSITRQKETDHLVGQLEDRYRKLLENQQSYYLLERKKDVNLIAELKSYIGKNCNACCTLCKDDA